MSTETTEAPATEAPASETAEPATQAPKPAPGAEVAIRTQPAAMAMGAKMKYAEMLAKSGLLPRDYRHNPANVLFGVEYGQMLGLQPMAAITGIHVIDGKPTASAGLISALVRRAGHKLRVGYDASKMTGWAEIVRADDPGYTFRSEWDLERAVTAELCTIKDGKPLALDSKGKSLPWRKFYPSMTKARAITEVARDACEEVLFGLHYTPEELGATVDGDGSVIIGQFADDDMPAPVVTDQPWLDSVHERAAGVGEADYAALWKEAVDGQQSGKCTEAELKHAQGLIRARIEDVRRAAAEAASEADVVDAEVVEGVVVDEPGLEPEDTWFDKVQDIAGDEDAAAAKADLRTSLNAGSITSDRFQQVLAAIDARLASLGGQVAA
jgi:hypothetical protein